VGTSGSPRRAGDATTGTSQGVFIRGRSTELPVLLDVHGGIPDYFLTARHPNGLEDDFIVASWEQRGAGLAHAAADPTKPVAVDELVSDAIEVTNYLRGRPGPHLPHESLRGTFIGIQVVHRAPELFHAYVGVGQITDQLESEQQGRSRRGHNVRLGKIHTLVEQGFIFRSSHAVRKHISVVEHARRPDALAIPSIGLPREFRRFHGEWHDLDPETGQEGVQRNDPSLAFPGQHDCGRLDERRPTYQATIDRRDLLDQRLGLALSEENGEQRRRVDNHRRYCGSPNSS
jgi:hypothetical protein